jgi:hypothetical protein
MQRPGRKNLRLQEKLDAIQREIARVEGDIKGISSAVDAPDQDEALRRLKQVRGIAPTPLVPTSKPFATGSARQDADEFPERQPGSTPVYRGAAGVPDGGLTEPVPRTVSDQRFTTYFGSSGLHSVRPLRQERRVQRNKAIFMLCIAGLVIFLVLKMIL